MPKNKLKIKLFRPPGFVDYPTGNRPPYGMGIITAVLRRNGYEVQQDDLYVKSKNFNSKLGLWSNRRIDIGIFLYMPKIKSYVLHSSFNHTLDQLATKLLNLTSYKGFDVIGFSLHSQLEFLFALLLAEKIKKELDVFVVFGGPFVTLYADYYFKEFKFIDYMIIGDGGVPFLKLLSFLENNSKVENVPNLFYRNGGEVKVNHREYFDIEHIPLPDFQGLPLDLYKWDAFGANLVLSYQISRGCLGRCSFCTFRKVDRNPEIKSPAKVLEELKVYNRQYKTKYFSIVDTTFNLFPEQVEEICDLLFKNRLNIWWDAFVRVDALSERLLYKMKRAGCAFLKMGIESGSDRMLKLMGKGFTVKQASNMLRISHKMGIMNRVYLMVGYPHERQEDIDATIRFIKENKEYIQSFSIYKFYLGYNSYIYMNPQKYGVENLRLLTTGHFEFDEIGGLKWKEKFHQQTKARLQILKAVYKDVLNERYYSGFLPFHQYCWWQENKTKTSIQLLLRFLPKKILSIAYFLETNYFSHRLFADYDFYITKQCFPSYNPPGGGG